MDNLYIIKESQGFTPSASRSRLIYQFEKEHEEESLEEETANSWTYAAGTPQKGGHKSVTSSPRGPGTSQSPKKPLCSPLKTSQVLKPAPKPPALKPSPKTFGKPINQTPIAKTAMPVNCQDVQPISVLKRAAMFDSPRTPAKDPTELSLTERKALFERNKGYAPIPKMVTPSPSVKHAPASEMCKAPSYGSPVINSGSAVNHRSGFNKLVTEQSLSGMHIFDWYRLLFDLHLKVFISF